MLNLSILLVTVPIWAAGFVLLAVALRIARQRKTGLALATIPVEHIRKTDDVF